MSKTSSADSAAPRSMLDYRPVMQAYICLSGADLASSVVTGINLECSTEDTHHNRLRLSWTWTTLSDGRFSWCPLHDSRHLYDLRSLNFNSVTLSTHVSVLCCFFSRTQCCVSSAPPALCMWSVSGGKLLLPSVPHKATGSDKWLIDLDDLPHAGSFVDVAHAG
jgi:hypothetical protein